MQMSSSISPREDPISSDTGTESNDIGNNTSTTKKKKKTKSSNLSDEQKKVSFKHPKQPH